jgi:Diacylglycerol kinase catalytic domain
LGATEGGATEGGTRSNGGIDGGGTEPGGEVAMDSISRSSVNVWLPGSAGGVRTGGGGGREGTGREGGAGGGCEARDEGGGGGWDARPEGGGRWDVGGRDGGGRDGSGGRDAGGGSPSSFRGPASAGAMSPGRRDGSGEVSSLESTVPSSGASSGTALGTSSQPRSTSDGRNGPGGGRDFSPGIGGQSVSPSAIARRIRGSARVLGAGRKPLVPPKISVVLNPNARGTRRALSERARRLERIMGPDGAVYATRTLEELGDAVRQILREPPIVLVTDGGDGTLHWVLNEARSQVPDIAHIPPLLPTNGGTIDFVARRVGIRGHAESIVRSLTQKLDRGDPLIIEELDTMRLTGTTETGEPFDRLGFALAAGGIGQRFFSKYYAEKQLGAGAIVRVVAKAVTSFAAGLVHVPLPGSWLGYGREVFRPTRARVAIDGAVVPSETHGAIHAGSIEVALGGVFRVFPLARERGRLHFQAGLIIPSEIIRALPSLVQGGAIPSELLWERGGSEMTIDALDEEGLAPIIDGEAFEGLRSLTVSLGPLARVPVVRG